MTFLKDFLKEDIMADLMFSSIILREIYKLKDSDIGICFIEILFCVVCPNFTDEMFHYTESLSLKRVVIFKTSCKWLAASGCTGSSRNSWNKECNLRQGADHLFVSFK
jgi:hypothetical protein